MAPSMAPDPTLSKVHSLITSLPEFKSKRHSEYIPFNFTLESPKENSFTSDREKYLEEPAIFSTRGTLYPKREAPVNSIKADVAIATPLGEHPYAVKAIAARIRADFPLDCKGVTDFSWQRLPYYFDDLDIHHWGVEFLERVLLHIYQENAELHQRLLRFAVHLVATDCRRAKTLAQFGRAVWYYEEMALYGCDFLEQMVKFMTHDSNVYHKLEILANKYLQEARGETNERPMWYDQEFAGLTAARNVKQGHSAQTSYILKQRVQAPPAPMYRGPKTSTLELSDMSQIAPESAMPRESRAVVEKVLKVHHRRTSSLSTELDFFVTAPVQNITEQQGANMQSEVHSATTDRFITTKKIQSIPATGDQKASQARMVMSVKTNLKRIQPACISGVQAERNIEKISETPTAIDDKNEVKRIVSNQNPTPDTSEVTGAMKHKVLVAEQVRANKSKPQKTNNNSRSRSFRSQDARNLSNPNSQPVLHKKRSQEQKRSISEASSTKSTKQVDCKNRDDSPISEAESKNRQTSLIQTREVKSKVKRAKPDLRIDTGIARGPSYTVVGVIEHESPKSGRSIFDEDDSILSVTKDGKQAHSPDRVSSSKVPQPKEGFNLPSHHGQPISSVLRQDRRQDATFTSKMHAEDQVTLARQSLHHSNPPSIPQNVTFSHPSANYTLGQHWPIMPPLWYQSYDGQSVGEHNIVPFWEQSLPYMTPYQSHAPPIMGGPQAISSGQNVALQQQARPATKSSERHWDNQAPFPSNSYHVRSRKEHHRKRGQDGGRHGTSRHPQYGIGYQPYYVNMNFDPRAPDSTQMSQNAVGPFVRLPNSTAQNIPLQSSEPIHYEFHPRNPSNQLENSAPAAGPQNVRHDGGFVLDHYNDPGSIIYQTQEQATSRADQGVDNALVQHKGHPSNETLPIEISSDPKDVTDSSSTFIYPMKYLVDPISTYKHNNTHQQENGSQEVPSNPAQVNLVDNSVPNPTQCESRSANGAECVETSLKQQSDTLSVHDGLTNPEIQTKPTGSDDLMPASVPAVSESVDKSATAISTVGKSPDDRKITVKNNSTRTTTALNITAGASNSQPGTTWAKKAGDRPANTSAAAIALSLGPLSAPTTAEIPASISGPSQLSAQRKSAHFQKHPVSMPTTTLEESNQAAAAKLTNHPKPAVGPYYDGKTQDDVKECEDPLKLYVAGIHLDDEKLVKIFEPFRPSCITKPRLCKSNDFRKPRIADGMMFTFVTFKTADACQEASNALSSQIKEGIYLKVNSAYQKEGLTGRFEQRHAIPLPWIESDIGRRAASHGNIEGPATKSIQFGNRPQSKSTWTEVSRRGKSESTASSLDGGKFAVLLDDIQESSIATTELNNSKAEQTSKAAPVLPMDVQNARDTKVADESFNHGSIGDFTSKKVNPDKSRKCATACETKEGSMVIDLESAQGSSKQVKEHTKFLDRFKRDKLEKKTKQHGSSPHESSAGISKTVSSTLEGGRESEETPSGVTAAATPERHNRGSAEQDKAVLTRESSPSKLGRVFEGIKNWVGGGLANSREPVEENATPKGGSDGDAQGEASKEKEDVMPDDSCPIEKRSGNTPSKKKKKKSKSKKKNKTSLLSSKSEVPADESWEEIIGDGKKNHAKSDSIDSGQTVIEEDKPDDISEEGLLKLGKQVERVMQEYREHSKRPRSRFNTPIERTRCPPPSWLQGLPATSSLLTSTDAVGDKPEAATAPSEKTSLGLVKGIDEEFPPLSKDMPAAAHLQRYLKLKARANSSAETTPRHTPQSSPPPSGQDTEGWDRCVKLRSSTGSKKNRRRQRDVSLPNVSSSDQTDEEGLGISIKLECDSNADGSKTWAELAEPEEDHGLGSGKQKT